MTRILWAEEKMMTLHLPAARAAAIVLPFTARQNKKKRISLSAITTPAMPKNETSEAAKWGRVIILKLIVVKLVKKSVTFYGTLICPIPCSQDPATGDCPGLLFLSDSF